VFTSIPYRKCTTHNHNATAKFTQTIIVMQPQNTTPQLHLHSYKLSSFSSSLYLLFPALVVYLSLGITPFPTNSILSLFFSGLNSISSVTSPYLFGVLPTPDLLKNFTAIHVTNNTPITPAVKKHLVNVYTTLTVGILSAAIGSLFFLQFHLGGGISFICALGLILWLAITPKEQTVKRVALLLSFCFLEGIAIAPLVWAFAEIDPSIVITAFLGTVCVFGCFSASAVFAERRSYLYLGGLCGSALSMLITFNFLNIFFRSAFLFNASLYIGLLVFCGYIMFDTQLMIEKAQHDEKDFIWDALQLFLDFINVFIRILIILGKNKEKK